VQERGDLAIRVAVGEELEHLALALRQDVSGHGSRLPPQTSWANRGEQARSFSRKPQPAVPPVASGTAGANSYLLRVSVCRRRWYTTSVGHTATIIAVFYTVVSVIAIVFMVFIAVSTRRRRQADEATLERLGESEKTWFVVVVVLLVAMLFGTIFFTPYGRSAGKDPQVEPIKALQFAWIVPGKPLEVGRPVKFELTSADVSHGFAVYNSRGEFVFQVQVLPGRTQTYVYTFRKPGTYKILCLEFCGVGHDKMQSQLTVVS
jgi:cytochrome c oxidase subunit 2